MDLQRKKSMLVINPLSGSYLKRRTIPRVVSLLQRHFPEILVVKTEKKGDAGREVGRSVEGGIELVFCAGGDGTINEVIQALRGSRVILAVIPAGTGNALAREIGLSLSPVRAIGELLSGRIVTVYPGLINDHAFMLVSGAGLDAFVAGRTDHRYPLLKKSIGLFSFPVVGILAGWRYPFPQMTFRLDGRELRGYGILVLKGQVRIGIFSLAPQLSIEKRELGIFIFVNRGIAPVIFFFLAVLTGKQHRLSSIPFYTVREVVAGSADPVPVEMDGELTDPVPVRWSGSENGIQLLVPAK
jgi:YegS/Rv2252/BmrU family lipid kinase